MSVLTICNAICTPPTRSQQHKNKIQYIGMKIDTCLVLTLKKDKILIGPNNV